MSEGTHRKQYFGGWGALLNDWVSPIAVCLVHPSALSSSSLQHKVTQLLRLFSVRPDPGFLWSCDYMAALAASNCPMKVKYFTWQPSLQTLVIIILAFFLTREELFFHSLDFHQDLISISDNQWNIMPCIIAPMPLDFFFGVTIQIMLLLAQLQSLDHKDKQKPEDQYPIAQSHCDQFLARPSAIWFFPVGCKSNIYIYTTWKPLNPA